MRFSCLSVVGAYKNNNLILIWLTMKNKFDFANSHYYISPCDHKAIEGERST